MPRYLAIALILIAAGTAQAAELLDRTFTVAPGGTLTVDADGASVHVSGSDGNQVVVHMLAAAPRTTWPTLSSRRSRTTAG